MNFGDALQVLKVGGRAWRKGWNGKKQYIHIVKNLSYIEPNGQIVNPKHIAYGNAAIAFVGTSGTQVGWLASQADMLAEDWVAVSPLGKPVDDYYIEMVRKARPKVPVPD